MCFYTNSKLSENSPFCDFSKKSNTHRNKFNKGSKKKKKKKNLSTENYKTLMKESEKGTNKWKDIPCSGIGMINIVKIPKTIYRFNAILLTFQCHLSQKLDK